MSCSLSKADHLQLPSLGPIWGPQPAWVSPECRWFSHITITCWTADFPLVVALSDYASLCSAWVRLPGLVPLALMLWGTGNQLA